MRRVEWVVGIAMLTVSAGESPAQVTQRPLREPQSVSEATAQLRSGSDVERQLAIAALPTLFGPHPPLADSATALTIVERVINETVRQRRDSGFYVLEDSIRPELRARLANRFRFIRLSEWQQMGEPRAALLLTVSGVERIGALARVVTEVRGPERPNEPRRTYRGGATYYLLQMNEVWTVVATSVWET